MADGSLSLSALHQTIIVWCEADAPETSSSGLCNAI
jgi:hypothetical protein